MLEVSSLGVPTVCFRDVGGPAEFVSGRCGMTVPHLDVAAMADCIAALLEDDQLRSLLGQRARRKVAERHGIETAAARIVRIMKEMLAHE
jgi:glycosyltransferase involved in cell wall biosynthesis